MAITLTSRAAKELRELMASENKLSASLRVWVAGGGCSGMTYGMALDENEPEEGDQSYEQDGLKIVIDGLSLQYMEGAQVDFVEDAMGGGFKIENPNAVNTCGCGSSFQAEDGQQPQGGCGSCGSAGG